MPVWLIPLIMAMLDPNGPVNSAIKTIGDVIKIGKANGMTDAEAQAIEDWYVGAIARRRQDAGLDDPSATTIPGIS
jgi:hypothetical protein